MEIFGRTYTLVSDRGPRYTREIAARVDRKMADVADAQNLSDRGKIAIMAALEIADDIMREREQKGIDTAAAEEARRRLAACVGVSDDRKDQAG